MQIIIDFGLVVLIWIVQLIIYPGFQYYEERNLLNWHKRYTQAITIIVLPLMLSQAIFHILGILAEFTWMKLVLLAMILAVWLITFLRAVPLHQNITNQQSIDLAVKSLIRINWYRTVFWTMIFLLQFIGL